MVSMQTLFYCSLMVNLFAVIVYAYHPDCVKIAMMKIKGKYCVLRWSKQGKLIPDPADKVGEFLSAKGGYYETEPEDMVSFFGIRTAVFYESYNRSANPEALALITKMKKEYGLDTIQRVQAFIKIPREKLLEDDPSGNLAEVQDRIKNEQEFILEKAEVIRPRDLWGYLKARNPLAVRGEIERQVYKERAKLKDVIKDYMPWILAVITLMMGGVLAYKMLGSGDASGAASTAANAASMIT